MSTGYGPSFIQEAFRVDYPQIIAMQREKAQIMGIQLTYTGEAYVAGTVLGRNTVSGYYSAYDAGGASGTDTAACILLENTLPPAATGTAVLTRGLFSGIVFQDKLTGLDSDAITDLKGTTQIGADGIVLLKF